MNYQIAIQQKMVTFKTLAEYENKDLTPAQRLSLTTSNLPSNVYNQYNQLYNSVTYAYAQAKERSKKDTDKLLSSNTTEISNMFFYKVLIDKGSNTELSNSKEVRNEYNKFTNIISDTYIRNNRKYRRHNKGTSLQVSNYSIEHAFRANFTSILLHSHALVVTNNKIPAKELEKIIGTKLPSNYNVQVQEFTKYKSSEQLIINDNNRYDKQVRTSLTNWLAYMYKTFAQKPFKNYVELAAFEQLSLEQRYNLIRAQQLITKGIRKHKTLAIHFPSTKVPKLRTKYLTYIPIINYTKQPTYTPVSNINNIYLTRSNIHSKAHLGLFTYMYIISNYLTLTIYDKPIIDTG